MYVEKPETYNGDITQWIRWSSSFTSFLKRLDDRWPKVFKKIDQQKGPPISSQIEETWASELLMGDVTAWKGQLMQLL